MTPAELGAVRQLVAYSDQRDREAAARLAAYAEGYAAGYEAGDLAGRNAVHEWYTAERRELAEALRSALAHPSADQIARRRWHVCCKPCRLAGHRDGCAQCEDRTPATFGDPHRDDYPGSLAGLRGAA